MTRCLPLSTLVMCLLVLFSPGSAAANTLQVGPGKPYAKPCAAIAAAVAGDTIEIDTTGNYAADVCGWSTNGLTIRGVGAGRAKLDAAGTNYAGKGIWVISGNDTTIENIEFTGATVPDQNGAGIRHQGGNLTIRNCYFHHNQEGILAGDNANATILVEYSEFAYNGFGDGYTHNIYVNHFGKLIFRFNYSHHSIIGHLLKSRAAENQILYNRFSDEATGTGSYEIDLPNGGKSFVIGNLVEQGPQTDNPSILAYLEEGLSASNPDTELFVVNNTFVNDYTGGTFVYRGAADTVAAVITNNIFSGPGTVTNQPNAVLSANFSGNPQFVNATGYDYHLTSGSPAVNAGTDPGTGAGVSLMPAFEYVHPACGETRTSVGAIDIGAYELGGGGAALTGCGSSSSSGGGTPPAPPPGAADFSLGSSTPATATITAGQTANYAITVASVNGFSGTVQFACSGAPKAAVCSVRPASLSLGSGGSAVVAVIVATSAKSQALLMQPWPGAGGRAAGEFAVLFGIAVGLFVVPRGRRKGGLRRQASMLWLLGMLCLAGCGGNPAAAPAAVSPSKQIARTPAGTYTLTLTATSGSVYHTMPLTLIVK